MQLAYGSSEKASGTYTLSGGTLVADATAEHIKITTAGMAVLRQPMDASGNRAAEGEIELRAHYDGTNLPLAITTASAIT